jgi:DNA-binding MarR family transcriptional regulator
MNKGAKSNAGSVAFLLSQVGARSAQEFARLIASLKLTPSDAGILRLLRQSPGISQQKLAQTLGMHASRLVGLIDELETRGLVLREANASDRRLYSLRLTDSGDEMLRSIGQVARMHNELMCSGLTADEGAELGRLLQQVATHHGLTPGVHPGYRSALDSKEQPSD